MLGNDIGGRKPDAGMMQTAEEAACHGKAGAEEPGAREAGKLDPSDYVLDEADVDRVVARTGASRERAKFALLACMLARAERIVAGDESVPQ